METIEMIETLEAELAAEWAEYNDLRDSGTYRRIQALEAKIAALKS